MTTADELRQMHKDIEEKYNLLKSARQEECSHNVVLLDNGFYQFGTYHPKRRCFDCGLTEIGGWWCYSNPCSHWHLRDDYNQEKAKLGDKVGREIRTVSEKEFCAAGVP